MADVFQFSAQARNEQYGKAGSRRMRREGFIPAILYGAGKQPQSISLSHNEIWHALKKSAVYTQILTINVEGTQEQAVLKHVQRHPSQPRVLHLDFQRIKAKEQLTMTVPIKLLGEEECPAIKQGGVLSKLITEYDIKCLPADLPENLELDISNLELDQTLHLSDIKLPKGVDLLVPEKDAEHDHLVLNVHLPKVSQADLEAEAAEAEVAAEAAKEAGAEKEEAAPSEAKEEQAGGESEASSEKPAKE